MPIEHPEGGAFGCRVLNPDGSFQNPARPLPTIRGALISALISQMAGEVSDVFESDLYYDWDGGPNGRWDFNPAAASWCGVTC